MTKEIFYMIYIVLIATFTASCAFASNTSETRPETEKTNSINSISEQENVRQIDYLIAPEIGKLFKDVPSDTSLPAEKAARIGIETLERFFNVNLEDKKVIMTYFAKQEAGIFRNIDSPQGRVFERYIIKFNEWYNILGITAEEFANSLPYIELEDIANDVGASIEEVWLISYNIWTAFSTFEQLEQPSRWGGTVELEMYDTLNILISIYDFMINAENGKVLWVTKMKGPRDIEHEDRLGGWGMVIDKFTGFDEPKKEIIINHAKYLVQKLNILDDDILSADILHYEPSIDLSNVVWVNIIVDVSSKNNKSVQLVLDGPVGGEKSLIGVTFN